MGAIAQVYLVDLRALRALMERREEALVEALIEQLGEEFGWDEQVRAQAQFLHEAARAVLVEGREAAPECGWVYGALVRMVESRLLSDGWRKDDSVELAPWAARCGLSESAVALLRDIAGGRTPGGVSVERPDDDVVACFLRPEEARVLAEELLALPESESGEVAEEILYNELLAALDHPDVAEGWGFVVLSL